MGLAYSEDHIKGDAMKTALSIFVGVITEAT